MMECRVKERHVNIGESGKLKNLGKNRPNIENIKLPQCDTGKYQLELGRKG